jgi:hypothetical protein
MTLFRLPNNTFVNIDDVTFARFDESSDDLTATLRFRDGTSETIIGHAALKLRQHLQAADAETEEMISSQEKHGGQINSNRVDSVSDGTNREAFPFKFDISGPIPVRLGRNKAWFHRCDERGRCYFLAFVNAKGSCSMRSFEAEKGIFLGKQYRSGNYQDQFRDAIKGATELTVDSQPNLERDCKERLPQQILAYLRRQVS